MPAQIKSLQRGTWTITDGNSSSNKTITEVILERAWFADMVPHYGHGSSGEPNSFLVASVTNSTTVNVSRGGSSGTSNVHKWQIIEEYQR